MRRLLALMDYAAGSLRRRAGKSAAVAAGLAFVVGLVGSALFLTGALRREHALAAEALPDLTVQRIVAGRPALIEVAAAEGLRHDIPAVRRVTPRVWGYLFVEPIGANLVVIGVAPSRMEADGRVLSRGRLPRAEGEVVLGQLLADRLAVGIGDRMALPLPSADDVRPVEVVGLFRAESAIMTADVLLAGEEDARHLLGVPEGMATDLAVDLTTPDEAPVVTRRIAERLPGARVLDRALLARTYELTFGARGGLLAALLLPALAAFLLLAWDRLAGLGAAERYEIGVLKAIGWETADVLAARSCENAFLALAGTVVGIVLAYLYVFVAGAPGLSGALLGWSNLYPPLELVPAVDAAELFALLGAVVVPFVAVGVVPSWRAAVLDPGAAVRGTV